MLEPPFEIVSCSWPRPFLAQGGRWCSEPEWEAPRAPTVPRARWRMLGGAPCWTIDWREYFSEGLRSWNDGHPGDMRGFHVVLRIRVCATGSLEFWDDDGSVIRRDGRVVHEDRRLHELERHCLEVRAGEVLEVAQCQGDWEWVWGARLVDGSATAVPSGLAALERYLPRVTERLAGATGPALKMYVSGGTPHRAVTAAYSMILNGYAPSRVLLYGEEQWDEWDNGAREVLARLLPFAEVVSRAAVDDALRAVAGDALVRLARADWYVMKACVAFFCEPREFCLLDDDVFILDRVDDALDAFTRHDMVYSAEGDNSDAYRGWEALLGRQWPLATGDLNAGLYWCRQVLDPDEIAGAMLRTTPREWIPFHWEQGLIAAAFSGCPSLALPSQRYFQPLRDGMPGGPLEYDYARNPCGFASVHFAGLRNKPDDQWMPYLAPAILTPRGARVPDAGAREAEVVAPATLPARPRTTARPLVSCIMPTRGRGDYVMQAVQYFLRQDYEPRELLILDDDDGEDLAPRLPADARIRYLRVAAGQTIGAKRNQGCALACGELLAQWDDDDWYGPGRLRVQAEPIIAGDADVTALHAELFFDLDRWTFWRCSDELHRQMFVLDVHGGTLMFRRRLWDGLARYPETSLAEDAAFLREIVGRGAALRKVPEQGEFIYLRHGTNSWRFHCGVEGDPGGWSQLSEPALPPEDRAFYMARASGTMRPRPGSSSRRSPGGGPLVSCIMPTADRRGLAPIAIRSFLRQDHARRELVIVDDGPAPIHDLLPSDPRIRYAWLGAERRSVGAKRQLACEMAAGELIAHWDDDDWSADWRLSYQAQALRQRRDVQLCGAARVLYYEPAVGAAWERSLRAAAGPTLCYRREWLAAHPHTLEESGDDPALAGEDPFVHVHPLEDDSFLVALLHPGNRHRKDTGGPGWRPLPVTRVAALLGDEWDAYDALRRVPSLAQHASYAGG